MTYNDEYVKIRPRRGSIEQWHDKNPVLSAGEMGVEYGDGGIGGGDVKIKLGDGTTNWNDLPYAIDPSKSTATSIVAGGPTSSNTISLKTGTTEEWLAADPVLHLGEIVFDITLYQIRIGDGIHKYSELRYIGESGS